MSAPDVDEIATFVQEVDGVVALHGGVYGEIATYLPGRRVAGIVVADDTVTVHVVVDIEHDLLDTARRIREAIAEKTGLTGVVVIEDVAVS